MLQSFLLRNVIEECLLNHATTKACVPPSPYLCDISPKHTQSSMLLHVTDPIFQPL